jgi:hypothetical protein
VLQDASTTVNSIRRERTLERMRSNEKEISHGRVSWQAC